MAIICSFKLRKPPRLHKIHILITICMILACPLVNGFIWLLVCKQLGPAQVKTNVECKKMMLQFLEKYWPRSQHVRERKLITGALLVKNCSDGYLEEKRVNI